METGTSGLNMRQSGEHETALEVGWQTTVHRAGDTVLRSPGPQSETVIQLLQHLDAAGFRAAPAPIGSGFAQDGREQLTYVEGLSPHPFEWTVEAAQQIGQLLRSLHEATADFEPPSNAVWKPWFARSLGGDKPVIGHGDLGPWNIMAQEATPSGFIDWDNAGPVDATWELAQVCWLNSQLHDDDVAARNHLSEASERIGRCAAILDGYELARSDREGLLER